MRDPLRPGACSTGACPGELIPGNESRIIPPSFVTQVIGVRIRLALNLLMKSLPRSIPLPDPGLPPWKFVFVSLRPFLAPMPLFVSSPAVCDRCASLCDFAVSFAVLRWLRRPLFEVPATLCRPLLARAAAANVDPRTQLSHVTEILQCVAH